MHNPASSADGSAAALDLPAGLELSHEVEAYLESKRFLVPLLHEAVGAVARHFGASARLTPELVVDAEGDGQPHLFLYVAAPLSLDDAMGRLGALDEDWWLDAMSRARGALTVEFDFAACSTGPAISP